MIIEKIKNQLNEILKKDGLKLPKKGILTGQAVASLYLKEIGFDKYSEKKDLIINDIDIFLYKKRQKINLKNKQEENIIETLSKKVITEDTSMFGIPIFSYDSSINLTLKNTFKKDNLNFIFYNNYYFADNGKLIFRAVPIENILDSFDMNCVKIGIDLEKNELYLSEDFKKFIKTGELEIVNFSTPLTSIVRFFEKREKLGYYGNETLNSELFKIMYIFLTKKYQIVNKNIYLSNQKYLKYQNICQNIKKLEFLFNEKNEFSYNLKKEDFNDNKEIFYFLEIFSQKSYEYFKPFENYFNSNNKYSFYIPFGFVEVLAKNFLLNPKNFNDKITSLINEMNFYEMYFYTIFFNFENDFYKYKNNLKILKQHPHLIKFFLECNNYLEIEELSNVLKYYIKEYKSESIIGVIEKNIKFKKDILDKDFMNTSIKKYYEDLKTPLKNYSFKTIKEDNIYIKELISKLELQNEGEKQKHCVGGYGEAVKLKESFIFKVQYFEHRFTLELRLKEIDFFDKEKNEENNSYIIAQAMYRQNQPVDRNIVLEVLKILNKNKLEYIVFDDLNTKKLKNKI